MLENRELIFFRICEFEDDWAVMFRNETVDLTIRKDEWLDKRASTCQQLANKILVGHNCKFKDLPQLKHLLQYDTLEGCNLEPGSKGFYNYWNQFLFLDLGEFVPDLLIIPACRGRNIYYNNLDTMLDVHYNALYEVYNEFKFNVQLKFMFMESDGFPFEKCLKTKMTKLTSLSLFTGEDMVDDTTWYQPIDIPDYLDEFFKQNIPPYIYQLYVQNSYDKIVELQKLDPSLFTFEFCENLVTMGKGGLHSVHNTKKVCKTNDEVYLSHDDGDSWYPNSMLNFDSASRNVDMEKFKEFIRDRQIEKKIDPGSLKTWILKIKINAVYGQSGSMDSLLYDRTAQFKTTILGQLMLLAYGNMLYKAGITIMQFNTDGIYIEVPRHLESKHHEIRERVSKIINITIDCDIYDSLYQLNVNNYVAVDNKGHIDVKGRILKDYNGKNISSKTYPIVQRAVFNNIIHGTPLMTTLHECKNIVDYSLVVSKGSYSNMVYGTQGTTKDINYTNYSSYSVSPKGLIKYINIYDDYSHLPHLRIIPLKGDKKEGVLIFNDGGSYNWGKSQGPGRNALIPGNCEDYTVNWDSVDYDFLLKCCENILRKL